MWLDDRTIAHLRELPEVAADQRYAFREEIGHGGMGTVYRAFDRELEREVAVKVLRTAAPGAAARLLREARIIGRLEHPGILPIHDVGTLDDGRVFYVMKQVRGSRLDEHALGGDSLADRLRLFDRLCDAVAFAHAHGVVHRDLKPENVMIGEFGEVLVLDWGVAKTRESAPEVPGSILGTPGFMAPEQSQGRIDLVDERSDVYALGGILAVLLRGIAMPRALKAIVGKARQDEPAARYQSARALADDVRRFAAGLAVEAYRENAAERVARLARVYRTPIVLVAAYLLMRLALLIIWGA